MKISLNGSELTLLPEKALYKEDERLLVIADVHLGKASHFRKEGISISSGIQAEDFLNLEHLFHKLKPARVYFLGDLFHSSYNHDWRHFCDLVALFPDIKFVLVKGNHDIINESLFHELCIEVLDRIEDDSFVYTHDKVDKIPKGKINIVGHIHPGVVLSGMGRQSIKLPCFYMRDNYFVLPAFGILTGLYSMERSADAKIFMVLPDGIKRL